ncbi:MAG: ASKHA domain-containing protein [Bacillota bacterium]|nr:ASKHA domain-containing protein [Bacillota bacterium]
MDEQVRLTIVEPDGTKHAYWIVKGKTLWEALQTTGWETGGSCGGQGTCGKCKVRVRGDVSSIAPNEQEFLIPDELKNGYRLACQCIANGDVEVCLDHEKPFHWAKKGLCLYETQIPNQSDVGIRQFYISGLQKEFPIPIFDRIKSALPDFSVEISVENFNDLTQLDRPGRPTIELCGIVLEKKKISYVMKKKQTLYGIALDLGSTSLFAALVDLENGEVMAVSSHTNMQRIYGEDIISRVSYCVEHENGLETLHRILINNVNHMIDELVEKTALQSNMLFKVTVVGNPVMLHLFLGVATTGFALAPYAGMFSDEMTYSGEQLGLQINPIGRVWILPQLGGFVGADTTSCLLTIGKEIKSFLLIDIGTNGEIVLGHNGAMWAASAAAGPAFEGGAITCGMRAGEGAIDRVYTEEDRLQFSVIGNGLPRGLCGSGIIDLIAVLLRMGCIEENGAFSQRAREIFQVEQGLWGEELVLIKGTMTASASPLILTQEDVRQIQLAKSAIKSAIDLIMAHANISKEELGPVYLAGAFGNYLRSESMMRIGLLPEVETDKIINIGNAAAQGAILALLFDDKMKESRSLKENVRYVELAEQKDFQDIFLKNLNF